jgi:ubiquinol-cytochrome c reductase cytochrome c1 subunit
MTFATTFLGRLRVAVAPVVAGVMLSGLAAMPAQAEELTYDKWPTALTHDRAALQRGARLFVNYCLNCHSASLMRWNRLRDIGIDEAQIKDQLIFGDQKVGDTMTIAMAGRDAKDWLGKTPPDLSVIIRARNTDEHRGTDYVYTLLRSFYRDKSSLTGWNNAVYPHLAMPNILWERQGPRTATITSREDVDTPAANGKAASTQLIETVSAYDVDGNVTITKKPLEHGTAGTDVAFVPVDAKASAATDADVADLVAYLNWMSEPTAVQRFKVGVWVMGFMAIFLLVGRWLNAVFWRDIK